MSQAQLIINWFIAATPPVIYAMLAVFIPYELIRQMGIGPLLLRTGQAVWKRVKPRLYW